MKPTIQIALFLLATNLYGQELALDWITMSETNYCRDMAVAASGNVYTTGNQYISDDFIGFVQKHNEHGTLQWQLELKSPNSWSYYFAMGTHIRVDGLENIYVAGRFGGTIEFDPGQGNHVESLAGGSNHGFLAKYDSAGTYIWHIVIESEHLFRFSGFCRDSEGNNILAGTYRGTVDFDPGEGIQEHFAPVNLNRVFLLKLDSIGDFVDFEDFGHYSSSHLQSIDNEGGLAIDAADRIYLAGRYEGPVDFNSAIGADSAADIGVYLLRVESDFSFEWVKSIESTLLQRVTNIICSSEGDIFVTGIFLGEIDLNPDSQESAIFVNPSSNFDAYYLKLNTEGIYQWAQVISVHLSSGYTRLVPRKMAIDEQGDLYIHGGIRGTVDLDPGENTHIFTTVSLNGIGMSLYYQKLSGIDGSHQFAYVIANSGSFVEGTIAVDAHGSIYQSGAVGIPFLAPPMATLDFDPGPGHTQISIPGDQEGYVWKVSPCIPDTSEIDLVECSAAFSPPDGSPDIVTNGQYTFHLTTPAGCDSTLIVDLTFAQPSGNYFSITTCDAYFWDVTQELYDESGEYFLILPNAAGCDSLISLDLTINESSIITETILACDSFMWESSGEMLVQSGIYEQMFQSQFGCDSLRIIDLQLFGDAFTEIEVLACDSYESPSGNYIYTETGLYQDTLQNIAGCDSVISINLQLNESSQFTYNATSCLRYTSDLGVQYTESGQYEEIFTNSQGCDSVVTLQLTIHQMNVEIEQKLDVLSVGEIDASYQWLDCENDLIPIEDATSQQFSPEANGVYAVQVSTNFCTDTSACFVLNNLSELNADVGLSAKLYPNPGMGSVFIALSKDISDARLYVYTLHGKLIDEYFGNLSDGMELPIRPTAPGVYMVVIKSQHALTTLRLSRTH